MASRNKIDKVANGANEVCQDRLWFLESIDRISRAMQATDGMEQLSHVLETVLSIFGCDRVWVAYPCDAESGRWRTVTQRASLRFADSSSLDVDLSMDAEIADVFRLVRASEVAVRFGAGAGNPVQSILAERFGVQSQMCLAVNPKIGKPYTFGLDQCSSPRIWTSQEQALFQATGQRLATLLTSLLMSHDLQESKARLEEAQRVAHVGHWDWNLETGEVIWSDETYRIFGFKPQERPMDIATVSGLVHPDDREALYSEVDVEVAAGVHPVHEHRIVRPSGEVRTVHSITSKLWSAMPGDLEKKASGKPHRLFGTVQDITELKRAEESRHALSRDLKESKDWLEEAQRVAHLGYWVWDLDAGQVIWSEETYRIFGLAPHAGYFDVGKVREMIHPDDREAVFRTAEEAIRSGTRADCEHRLYRPDGEMRIVHSLGDLKKNADGRTQIFGTTQDITDRKRVEKERQTLSSALQQSTHELRREQAYLAEAQSLAHIGSWSCNLATREIFHSSDENARLYGFDPSRGPLPFDLFYNTILPEDEQIIRPKLERAISAGADYDVEFQIRRTDGDIRFLRGIGHHNPSQEVGEYFGITIDTTERKRAEEERERLRQLEADLAHINRVNMMGELAAALAHEIKQPIAASITSANACLRWLGHDPPDLERARAAAARVDREGNRAADIINSLRSFYKTGTPGERQMVDVKGAIEEMSVLLRTEAARYAVTIHQELESNIPNILADRVQLQQILMNLMLNAIEAMKDCGGTLTIGSGVNSEGHLIVSISDTGVGLPAESAELIFDPFHTTKPQGTGMGLTITRSIVEAYGGRVWATSNRGAGATFHFTLPGGTEAHA